MIFQQIPELVSTESEGQRYRGKIPKGNQSCQIIVLPVVKELNVRQEKQLGGWVGKQLKVGKRIVSLVSLLVEKTGKKNVYPYTLKK